MKTTYELAIKWFDALKFGRIDELISYMDDNISWVNCRVVEGYSDVIPWLGTYKGKYEVAKTFEIHGELTVMDNFDLIEIFVDGDTMLVHAYETNRLIETDEIYHADVFFQMKRDGDKVIEWEAIWDTAEAVAAFKKKET